MNFAASFEVVSPGGAYTDATGAAQVAPANTPRFDHDAEGNPLGLLVQGVPEAASPDLVTLSTGLSFANQGYTVLHQIQRPDGRVVSQAWWSRNPVATINGLLNAKGWHRSIIVLDRALPVVDGAVIFRGQAYAVAALLAIDPSHSHVLGIGGSTGAALTGVD